MNNNIWSWQFSELSFLAPFGKADYNLSLAGKQFVSSTVKTLRYLHREIIINESFENKIVSSSLLNEFCCLLLLLHSNIKSKECNKILQKKPPVPSGTMDVLCIDIKLLFATMCKPKNILYQVSVTWNQPWEHMDASSVEDFESVTAQANFYLTHLIL